MSYETPSKSFKRHAPLIATNDTRPCWANHETPQPFRNQTLAARQTTDTLLLDFSSCLYHYSDDMALHWTFAQALKISGAKLLELDSRELGTTVIPAGDLGRGFGAVLYDNVPGGAGHVLELMILGREWLLAARETMFVNDKHNEMCQTACLDCLLTFDAQEPMQRGLLHRLLAIRILDALLDGRDLPVIESDLANMQPTSPVLIKGETASLRASERTSDARFKSAGEKMGRRKRFPS